MSCEQVNAQLGALLDRELAGEEHAAAVEHLRHCAACTREFERLQMLQRRLLGARLPLPPALLHRVRARIASEASSAADAHVPAAAWLPRAFARVRPYLRQAAVLVVTCGISTAAALWWARSSREIDLIARDVVAAHVRGLLQESTVQVASLDTHSVKPWFAGRLDFTPVVKDLSREGFRLVGGRLDYVGGQRVAVLVYGRQKHQISVFTWPATAEQAPSVGAPSGFNVIAWTRGGMAYWAISDLAESELAELPPLL